MTNLIASVNAVQTASDNLDFVFKASTPAHQ